MHYILECPPITTEANEALVEIQNTFTVAGIRLWNNGMPLDFEKKKNIPIPIEMDYDVFQDYSGDPPEVEDLGIPIMSERLKNVFDKSNVQNIEYFPAALRNSGTNEVFWYYAFNITGLVSRTEITALENTCANASKAMIESRIQAHRLLFRLQGSYEIIVHDFIKTAIE